MRIVAGLDGTEASLVAHELLTRIRWPQGTIIRLVTAYEPSADWARRAANGRRTEAWDSDPQDVLLGALDRLAGPLRGAGYGVELRATPGAAPAVLLDAARELAADLILVGSRGRGPAASALLGSVSAELADHALCPVLVARLPRVSRILLGADGSPSVAAIPAILGHWRAFSGVPVDVLSVAPPGAAAGDAFVTPWAPTTVADQEDQAELERHQSLAQELADGLVAAGWDATPAVRIGSAAREIVQAADDRGCDLIITGSRGLGDLQRLIMGSVAHDVLLHAHCSVMVMRGHVPARSFEPARAPVNAHLIPA